MGALRQDRIGRYELLIELGRGGMAELFLGRLHGAGGFAKLVAIKRILPHLASDAQFRDMFLNEARIAAHLSHPNICQVFELEESDDELFLAMEYLDGVSWEHLIATSPRMRALHLTAGVMLQAAEGLHYAHTLRDIEGTPTPVIHRDVSPQNLFVTVDGVCKVLDFGVSKMMTDGPRTRSGVVKGKLPYMAPEQIRGEEIDARADVFALGVVAWEALAAARLFDRPTDFMIWKAITEEPAPSIASRWPECPPAVDAVVRSALDRARDRRQASARQFGEELRAAAGSAAGIAEIAHAVRTQCADRIATRQRQVATAVSSRRNSIPDRDAATTLDDANSMQLRQQSHKHERPTEMTEAAETRDLGPSNAESTTELDAAETAHLPPRPPPEPDAAATVDDRPRPRVPDADDSLANLRPRSSRGKLAVAGVVAVAAIAAVIVIATRTQRAELTRSEPAPPVAIAESSETAPAPSDPAPPAPVPVDETKPVPAKHGSAKPPRSRETPRRTAEPTVSGEIAKLLVDAEEIRRGADELRKAGDQLRDMGREVRGEPARNGFYTIDSKPFGTVYANGTKLGTTPIYRLPLASGRYEIRIVLESGKERLFPVDIEAGKETSSGMQTW